MYVLLDFQPSFVLMVQLHLEVQICFPLRLLMTKPEKQEYFIIIIVGINMAGISLAKFFPVNQFKKCLRMFFNLDQLAVKHWMSKQMAKAFRYIQLKKELQNLIWCKQFFRYLHKNVMKIHPLFDLIEK